MELEATTYHLLKETALPLYKDYTALKELGYERIAAYSGSVWTNYNDSDPGITMLQVLCYALTELGNKADLPMRNLLARENGSIPMDHRFYTPQEAYTSNPVTRNDICKLILDAFPEVKQVYLTGALKGLPGALAIFVECKPDVSGILDTPNETAEAHLRKKIALLTRQTATVGRWMTAPIVLQPRTLGLWGSVQIKNNMEVEYVIAHLLYYLNAYLSPYPVYTAYTGDATTNTSLADSLQGPVLSGGYIPDTCIAEKKQKLTADEAGSVLLDTSLLDEVQLTGISASGNPQPEVQFSFDEAPAFGIESFRQIVFTQNAKHITSWNNNKVLYYYQQLVPQQVNTPWEDLAPAGEYRNVGAYYSIQYDFPSVYQLTGKTKYDSARQAKIRQLKSYLILYEQFLADYAASLANVSSFFSFESGRNNTRLVSPTYQYQPLYQVPGIEEVLSDVSAYASMPGKSAWQAFMDDGHNRYRRTLNAWVEGNATNLERKKRSLGHLLARSGKQYDHQPLSLTNPNYGSDTIAEIEYLERTLNLFPELSGNRTRTYYKSSRSGAFVSGVQLNVENELSLETFYRGIEEMIYHGLGEGDTITIATQQNKTLHYLYPAQTAGKHNAVPGRDGCLLVWCNDMLVFSFITPASLPEQFTTAQARSFLDPYLKMLGHLRDFKGFVFVDTVRLVPSLRMQWTLLNAKKEVSFASERLSPDLAGKQFYLISSGQPLQLQQSRATMPYEIGVKTNQGWNFLCANIKTEEAAKAILADLEKLAAGNNDSTLKVFITDHTSGIQIPASKVMNTAISFLPGWIDLFQQPAYQKLLMEKLTTHTPACSDNGLWLLSLEEMQQVTDSYAIWMKDLARVYDGHAMDLTGRAAAEKLFHFIYQLPSQ